MKTAEDRSVGNSVEKSGLQIENGSCGTGVTLQFEMPDKTTQTESEGRGASISVRRMAELHGEGELESCRPRPNYLKLFLAPLEATRFLPQCQT